MSQYPPEDVLGPRVEPAALPGLEGRSIASVSTDPTEEASGIAPSEAHEPGHDHSAFATFVHEQVRDNIRFADQKAALLFAAAAAMLAFLHDQGASAHWLQVLMAWTHLSVFAFLGMVGLSCSILLAAVVVYPRTAGESDGLLFWGAISKRPTDTDYVHEVMDVPPRALVEATLSHTHELALISDRKYAALRRAFPVSAVGFTASVLYLLFA